MKVTTDACLFGSYAANEIRNHKSKIINLLDVGAGTGLLGLMVAQKNDCIIDAVEIDTASYLQAKENFERAEWSDRLNIYNADVLNFDTHKKYDCIISNPPFFENDLKSVHLNKNNAKHDTALTLQQLLKAVDILLNADGLFFVLLPYHRADEFVDMALVSGLYPAFRTDVKQTPKHSFFRTILIFSRTKKEYKTLMIVIKDEQGNYTNEFTFLLQDYYLAFNK